MQRRAVLLALLACPALAMAADATPRIGVVVMHGKGGSPQRHVDTLAQGLERRGLLVANLDMPWSGRRNYDATLEDAVTEVATALAGLRQRGATHVFLAGHSQGGVFAFHAATRIPLNGVIAIAPGGSVATPVFREQLGATYEEAKSLIAAGRGKEVARLADFEGAHGRYPITTTPERYVTWFDPDGGMNMLVALRKLDAKMPVLYVAPTGDYPALLKSKPMMVAALPSNPLTVVYEPSATHLQAPAASVERIVEWTAVVTRSESAMTP